MCWRQTSVANKARADKEKKREEMHYRARGVGRGTHSCGCTSWPVSCEATSSLFSSLGARTNTRSKHWRQETRRWGGRDTRDSSPLVTPLPLPPPRSSTFSISPLLPRQPLVLDSFVTLLEFPCHASSHSLTCDFLNIHVPCSPPWGVWTTIEQTLYGTNITWHAHF